MSLRGVIRGRTIELERDPHLPDGARLNCAYLTLTPFGDCLQTSLNWSKSCVASTASVVSNCGELLMKPAILDTDILLDILNGRPVRIEVDAGL
jgi:hypothetical protein